MTDSEVPAASWTAPRAAEPMLMRLVEWGQACDASGPHSLMSDRVVGIGWGRLYRGGARGHHNAGVLGEGVLRWALGRLEGP